MPFWTKIQLWAAAAGGLLLLIGGVLLRVFTMGRQAQRADQIVARRKDEEQFNERIDKAQEVQHTTESDLRKLPPDRLREDDGYRRD